MSSGDLTEAMHRLKAALRQHNPDFNDGIQGMMIGRALLVIAAKYGAEIPEDERLPNSRILPQTVDRLTQAIITHHRHERNHDGQQ